LKTSKTFDDGNPTEHFARSKLAAFNPALMAALWGPTVENGP
jgi:hypothetical protein